MKRIFAALCMLALLIQCAAFAEEAQLQDIGPYTFDTYESSNIVRYSETQLFVEYPLTSPKSAALYIEYCTYDELGTTYEGIMDIFVADDPWTLAYMLLDNWYTDESSNGAYYGYETEDTSPYFSPAASRFHCYTGRGYMAGALFVSEEGLLFFHLDTSGMSINDAARLRDALIRSLSFHGMPVLGDTPDPTAPQTAPLNTSGDPITITLGSFHIPVEGYITLDTSNGNSIYLDYPESYINVAYFPQESVSLMLSSMEGMPVEDASDRELAEGFFKLLYQEPGLAVGAYQNIQIDNPGPAIPLLFSGRLNSDYGSGYGTGAVLMDSGNLLVVEVLSRHRGLSRTDVCALRDDFIAGIYLDSDTILGSIYVNSRHTGYTLGQEYLLRLGKAFTFDASSSKTFEKQPDSERNNSDSSHPGYNIYYDDAMLYLYYEPYEYFGQSRESMLRTVSSDNSETALIQYISNLIRYGAVESLTDSFSVDGIGAFGDHAWLRFSYDDPRGSELTSISGLIITQEDSVLIAFMHPNNAGVTGEDSAKMLDGYLENLSHNGFPVELK